MRIVGEPRERGRDERKRLSGPKRAVEQSRLRDQPIMLEGVRTERRPHQRPVFQAARPHRSAQVGRRRCDGGTCQSKSDAELATRIGRPGIARGAELLDRCRQRRPVRRTGDSRSDTLDIRAGPEHRRSTRPAAASRAPRPVVESLRRDSRVSHGFEPEIAEPSRSRRASPRGPRHAAGSAAGSCAGTRRRFVEECRRRCMTFECQSWLDAALCIFAASRSASNA